MPAWELSGIVKRYRTGGVLRRRDDHTAVAGVSLTARTGERIGIVGESGSGKTTLALVGLGLVPRDDGTVKLFNTDTAGWSRHQWRKARRDAQMLFQNPRAMLNPSIPLGLLLQESASLHRPDSDARGLVQVALEEVGLQGRESARVHELSGGEVRRAGIARLLLARPRLVVADEPTAGLDANLKANLVELLLRRVGPTCTVVLISHDIPMVAWACSRLVVMKDGDVVDRFATDALASHDHHPYTRTLLSAAGMRL